MGERDEGTGMWGGRFRVALDPVIEAYTDSLPFDRRLLPDDLVASLAHVRMLRETGVVPEPAADRLLTGLSSLLEEAEREELTVEGDDEDVHAWIERVLRERIGPDADHLQTARSRNDQTSAALRLFTRRAIEELVAAVLDLADRFRERSEAHLESWMPGYTHLQRGQPSSLAHHLLAHGWALEADARRLRRVHESCGRSPLGAGAVSGTAHPVDPELTARLLGFEGTVPNSVLAVADRDYVAEALFACALLMIHLSRWAEEVVLWSSSEFGFVELDDAVAQGSSLMPQKKNPEAAELMRGKSGRALGDLLSLLVTLKGLPFAYNSDLQEDKEPLFDALDTARESVRAAAVLLDGATFREDRLAGALRNGFVTATDMADLLVRRGTPFREAHSRVGSAVLEAERRECELWELPADALASCCPELSPSDLEELRPESAVRARELPGGPGPARVREQATAFGERLEGLRRWLDGLDPPPVLRAHRAGAYRREGGEG